MQLLQSLQSNRFRRRFQPNTNVNPDVNNYVNNCFNILCNIPQQYPQQFNFSSPGPLRTPPDIHETHKNTKQLIHFQCNGHVCVFDNSRNENLAPIIEISDNHHFPSFEIFIMHEKMANTIHGNFRHIH
jgi:hypothetical protein